MNNEFFLVDYDVQTIQGKKFLCVYVLELNHHTIFRIFKQHTDALEEQFGDLDIFCDITSKVDFVIKRDGKISLDIKL